MKLNTAPWEGDLLWQIADIIRTSYCLNPNFPNGFKCTVCKDCGNECTYDSDGEDCNFAFMEYFERELNKRGFYKTENKNLTK